MRVAKGRYNAERGENQKLKTDVIASAVMGNVFNPHVDHERAYIRYVSKELRKHPTFKTYLLVGMVSFDFSRLFTLPKNQAAACHARLFQSFCVCN